VPAEITGLVLGLVIGTLGAMIAVVLLSTVLAKADPTSSDVYKVVGELVALASFIFGGQFLAGAMLAGIDIAVMRGFYVLGVGLVLCPVVIYLFVVKARVMARRITENG